MYWLRLQIAKDMERWAKNVNAAKSAQQQQLQAIIQHQHIEAVPEPATVPDVATTPLSAIKRTGVPLASALATVWQSMCMSMFNNVLLNVVEWQQAIPEVSDGGVTRASCSQSSSRGRCKPSTHWLESAGLSAVPEEVQLQGNAPQASATVWFAQGTQTNIWSGTWRILAIL